MWSISPILKTSHTICDWIQFVKRIHIRRLYILRLQNFLCIFIRLYVWSLRTKVS